MNFWKYKIDRIPNVYHVEEWPIYKDFLKLCRNGDISKMNLFHSYYISSINKQFIKENPDLIFFDSEWRTHIKLDFDPYIKLMTSCAREIVSQGEPYESILWFSYHSCIDLFQIGCGIHTLIMRRQLKEAKFVLSVYTDLTFEKDDTIMREALYTNDIVLIHDLWLRAALKSKKAQKFCDKACENGWVPDDAKDWYYKHRCLEPTQKITDRFDIYLK